MSDPELLNRTAGLSLENKFRKKMAVQLNYTIITRHHWDTIYYYYTFVFIAQTIPCSIQLLRSF